MQPTPNKSPAHESSGANGHTQLHEIFALSDEQILEIDPAPQDAQVIAPELAQAQSGAAEAAQPGTPAPATAERAAAPAAAAGPFSTPEDARALKELYPGGLTQAKSAAERARALDEIDASYFGAAGNSPEQVTAARAELAQRMFRENPAAFREMVFAGLRALEAVGNSPVGQTLGSPAVNGAAAATGRADSSPTPAVAQAILAVRAPNEAQAGLPAAPEHFAAYTSFEKAANEELERSVGGAIDHALHQALPNLGSGEETATAGARHGVPLQARLSAAIRDDIDKSLQGDRQLGEQVAQILSTRRFDNETRAQVVRLIGDRARQLVPSAAKRALNDWTQATLSAHRTRTRTADASTSRADLAPAAGQGTGTTESSAHSVPRARDERTRNASAHAASSRTSQPAAPRSGRVDYRKLSDEQILDL